MNARPHYYGIEPNFFPEICQELQSNLAPTAIINSIGMYISTNFFCPELMPLKKYASCHK